MKYYTVAQFSERLGVSSRYVRRLITQAYFKSARLCECELGYMLSQEELENEIKKREGLRKTRNVKVITGQE